MLKLKIFVLSWLLHHANKTKAQTIYRIKDKLLQKYGKKIDIDLQILKRECWDCFGKGSYQTEDYHIKCCSCDGTGVYEIKTFVLEVWKFGKYEFHNNPTRKYNNIEDVKPRITYHRIIEHNPTKLDYYCLEILRLMYQKEYYSTWLSLKKTELLNFYSRLCSKADIVPFNISDKDMLEAEDLPF